MAGEKLLIIDDEAYIGAIIRKIAESCGFEVMVTASAEAFRNAFSSFKPNIIILDLAVPEMDGIELLRWLADAGCNSAILIASGFGGKMIEAARRLGEARGLAMRGVISKPIRLEEMRTVLNGLRGST